MAAEQRRVARFGRTERVLHTAHGAAFMVMLGSGLVLYLPALALAVSNRPVMKAVHLAAAVAWLTALALIALLGDRAALRRTRRDLERFDDDDLLWLRRRPAPQGRFNAGQKLHAVVQAALSVLFVVSGTLLWLGERNTSLRLPGTIALHDMAMFIASVFVVGHLYMAFRPDNRASLEGVVYGTVPADWAAEHHRKWSPDDTRPAPPWTVGRGRLALALAVVGFGIAGAGWLVRDVLHGAAPPGPAALARR